MKIISRSEDAQEYLDIGFERFYQQGVDCFVWGLPRALVRQAFHKVCADWRGEGRPVDLCHVRAFIEGAAGKTGTGVRRRRVPDSYRWPEPPDPSWVLLVCIYPDGKFDLDLAHPVSRRFWSEDHGFFELPTLDLALMSRSWFERMGFEVMSMQPVMTLSLGAKTPHLTGVP